MKNDQDLLLLSLTQMNDVKETKRREPDDIGFGSDFFM